MSAQIITSKGKPAFAVLPIAEYRRLLALAEDRADLDDANRVLGRITSGEEETLSAEFVAALVAAKTHPLRLWRKHRGLTLQALGDATGVTRSALSQIEGGKTRATAALLRKLADERRLDANAVRRAGRAARSLLRDWFGAGWLRRASD